MARWSEDQIAAVASRYASGEDDADIAKALGRTVGSVQNIRQAKGITRPREVIKRGPVWTDEELAVAARMYAEGEPNERIAAAVGRSRVAIKRAITDRDFKRDPSFEVDVSRFDADDEKWRRVPDGLPYAISTRGRVMSLTPGFVGAILAQWRDADGYMHVQLQRDGVSKRHAVHRIVNRAFHGEPPSPLHETAHNDGNPSNNSEGNLRWATKAENQADRIVHGTASRQADGKFVSASADMVDKARRAGVAIMEIPV